MKASFSAGLNRRFIFTLFLLTSISFVSGFYLGHKSLSKKQKIFQVLVKNPISRYFLLKNTTNEITRARNDLKSVTCPTDNLAIASFGQSNSANRTPRAEGLISIEDGKTFMWDWTTGKCYPYSESVVGTDGFGKGNILTDTIIQLRGQYSGNLIVIAFGRGGASIFEWSHRGLSVRLDAVLQRLKEHAIIPKVFLWHQGESDAIPEVYLPAKLSAYGNKLGSVSYFYQSALSLIVEKIRSHFQESIIGVALVSICTNDGSPLIIDAQRSVADKYANVRISSNTDLLGDEFRQDDRCHFNEAGAARIGKDYV